MPTSLWWLNLEGPSMLESDTSCIPSSTLSRRQLLLSICSTCLLTTGCPLRCLSRTKSFRSRSTETNIQSSVSSTNSSSTLAPCCLSTSLKTLTASCLRPLSKTSATSSNCQWKLPTSSSAQWWGHLKTPTWLKACYCTMTLSSKWSETRLHCCLLLCFSLLSTYHNSPSKMRMPSSTTWCKC